MEFHLCVLLYFVILFTGSEGDPYFNDLEKLDLPNGHEVNWMKSIDDETLLSAVTIPGTCQSMKMNTLDQHQAWTVTQQFTAGVRFFDISLDNSVVKDGSLTRRKFADVMEKMRERLIAHPHEVILIRLTPENGKAEKEIEKFIQVNDNVWKDKKVPKMKEVRGKIVLVQSSKFSKGLPVDLHVGGKEFKDKHSKKYMEAIYNHLKAAENAGDHIVVTETSAYFGFTKSSKNAAVKINPMLQKYIDNQPHANKPKGLGVIVMDYPGIDLIQKIIDINPKSEGSPESSPEEGENPPETDGEPE
ncbi:hypothetical protein ANANG_G00009220 [Anguilla anguilla]|uniref:PLCXD-like protein n=1 Tax=Anguilla anguilla TaxID=7936 RepID=A0A0E9WXY2_ANGAN|nr:hypothetical protein ANANG_G00009220 [Anguilla anguilla]